MNNWQAEAQFGKGRTETTGKAVLWTLEQYSRQQLYP
jgi:hypothetical protein